MKKISIFSIIVIIIDRIFKILVKNFLLEGVRNKIINNFFYLTFCKNEGAAFSILSGKIFLLIFIAFICLYFIYYLLKSKKNITKFDIICYGLLIGGIIGNFIDRVIYGYVIDYLDFEILNYRFAIFNFADMTIVISVILLLFFNKGSDEDGRNKSRSRGQEN